MRILPPEYIGPTGKRWFRAEFRKIVQIPPFFTGNIGQNMIYFFSMPNIHQIHTTTQKCKCKYFFIEKRNRPRRKILFSGAGLLFNLLQLSSFGEQVVDNLGGADEDGGKSSP